MPAPFRETAPARPTLVYDGDCGICRYWVRYWEGLTSGKVVYRAYQEAAAEYPAIPVDAFKRAIQYIQPDGATYAGAAATFRLLRLASGRGLWWWLYVHAPGFAAAAESAYRFFARRRGLLDRISRLLWGPTLEAERYDCVSGVFLRGLGLIYAAAFASLAVQILGLVGSAGVLPIESYLDSIRRHFGSDAYFVAPTLFWLNASDGALVTAAWSGVVLASLVVFGIALRPALIGLFVLYLSLTHAGQEFMAFQWDGLLLEAGFLAIFLTGGSRIVVWLYRWLVFRYLFMAGMAKLMSGDETWRGLTALDYHFWTQPLPTPLAWYAAQLPHGVLAALTALTLVIEVGLTFLVFAPRRLRAGAAWCIVVFEALVALTGNYNFFNLLTMLLCVFLFDDAALRAVVPASLLARVTARVPHPGRMATGLAIAVALVVVPAGLNWVSRLCLPQIMPPAATLADAISPLMIVNYYGLFANMTTERPEIVVEGSDDGRQWREYEFRYKPGALSRRPPWNIPHQPRLDWQMWFAALGGARNEPWFASLVYRLLSNNGPVVDLLAANPFADRPPRYVRALLYDYRFSDPATRAATGQWWVRKPLGLYFPVVTLDDFKR